MGMVANSSDFDATFFLELADDGTGKLPMNLPWEKCRTMPAWDDRNLIAMPTVPTASWTAAATEELVCWDVPKAVEELHASIDRGTRAQRF